MCYTQGPHRTSPHDGICDGLGNVDDFLVSCIVCVIIASEDLARNEREKRQSLLILEAIDEIQRRNEAVSCWLCPVRDVQFSPDGLLPIERGEGFVSTINPKK